jgi:hypothetical protein
MEHSDKWTIVTFYVTSKTKRTVVHAYDVFNDRREAEAIARTMRKKFPQVTVKVVKILEGLN